MSRIDDLELLCDKEKAFLEKAGTGSCSAVENIGVHRLFERWVQIIPEAIAVVHNDTRISYRELDDCANRLAWMLIEQGVSKGDIVGLCLQQARFFPVAGLAVMKVGAAYLPMDPGYPAHRIEHMVRDSAAALWLIDDTADLLAAYNVRTLDVSNINSTHADSQRASPDIDVGSEDLAMSSTPRAPLVFRRERCWSTGARSTSHRHSANCSISVRKAKRGARYSSSRRSASMPRHGSC